MTPDNTSPVPPVAMPGLPVGFTAARPSARATIVRWPFKSTTAPVSIANARAVSSLRRCTSEALDDTSRAISPGWGVTTVGAERRSASLAPFSRADGARAFKPSASTSSGVGHRRTSSRTNDRVPASWPRPGPRTTASRSLARARARVTAASSRAPPASTGSGERGPRRLAAVGGEAGGDVDGDQRGAGRLRPLREIADRLAHQARRRLFEPGSEQRIDEQIPSEDRRPRGHPGRLVRHLVDGSSRPLEDAQVEERVAPHLRPQAEKEDRGLQLPEAPGDDEPVAAVVALAAKAHGPACA